MYEKEDDEEDGEAGDWGEGFGGGEGKGSASVQPSFQGLTHMKWTLQD